MVLLFRVWHLAHINSGAMRLQVQSRLLCNVVIAILTPQACIETNVLYLMLYRVRALAAKTFLYARNSRLLIKVSFVKYFCFVSSSDLCRVSGSGKSTGLDAAIASFERSLSELQTDYVDLYLIHWPGCAKIAPGDSRNTTRRQQSWQELERLYRSGRCRAIGVSNYNISHLEDLLSHCAIAPHVNQVYMYPSFVCGSETSQRVWGKTEVGHDEKVFFHAALPFDVLQFTGAPNGVPLRVLRKDSWAVTPRWPPDKRAPLAV